MFLIYISSNILLTIIYFFYLFQLSFFNWNQIFMYILSTYIQLFQKYYYVLLWSGFGWLVSVAFFSQAWVSAINSN